MSTEVILIRHGQSTANASGVWQGQLDFPLSELGREQARHAGGALARERIDAVYSSPLSRARQTAEIVSCKARGLAEVETLEGFSERRGGLLEGTTPEQRETEMPELMEKFLALPDEDRWRLVGAETNGEVLQRFEDALSTILSRHGAGEKVVVVSHGGAMRAFLRSRLGPEVLPDARRAPNASITRLLLEPDGEPRLLELASASHLPTEMEEPAE